jgi:hypothetical protein
MRLVLSVCLSLSFVNVAPASAVTLSSKERKAYSCILKKARNKGNPDVAAYFAVDECPTQGLSDVQKKRVVDLVIDRLMKEYGLKCLGTGCGDGQ